MKELDFVKTTKEIENIKKEFLNTVDQLDGNGLDLIKKEYNLDLVELDEKNKLTIAFIGQYSAGKSSIIAALTDDFNINIGQDVTTDKISKYMWNNLILLDTPGIGTENIEHNEIAYKHMDLADLLIYVVTTQGFDALIASDFQRIAFDRNKFHKMMLVVNKTSLESQENKANWGKDIEKVISPLTLEDFKVTFIDVKDYLDSLKEECEQDKIELQTISNYSDFIGKINEFVNEKGLIGRLISELNVTESYLLKVLNEISTDDNGKKVMELLQRKEFLVEESKKNITKNIEREVKSLHTKVIELSNELISQLTIKADKDILEEEFQKITDQIDKKCEECGCKIEQIVDEELDDLIRKISELENSPLYREIIFEFNVDVNVDSCLKEKPDCNKLRKIPEVLADVGKFLGVAGDGFKNWCFNTAKVEKGLKAVAGSDAHKFILRAGHGLGKKFKPYGAIKIADKIGKAGKVLAKIGKCVGVAACLASPFIASYEQHQEDKSEKNIRSARIETRKNFRILADEIKETFYKNKNVLIDKVYEKELTNIKERMDSLRNKEDIQSCTVQKLMKLREEIAHIINKVKMS